MCAALRPAAPLAEDFRRYGVQQLLPLPEILQDLTGMCHGLTFHVEC